MAANSRLRALAAERCAAAGLRLRVPRPGLCTDDGAMVAALGAELVAQGIAPSPLDLPADSSALLTASATARWPAGAAPGRSLLMDRRMNNAPSAARMPAGR